MQCAIGAQLTGVMVVFMEENRDLMLAFDGDDFADAESPEISLSRVSAAAPA